MIRNRNRWKIFTGNQSALSNNDFVFSGHEPLANEIQIYIVLSIQRKWGLNALSRTFNGSPNIVIVVFNLNNRKTFEDIDKLIADTIRARHEHMTFVLVGDKSEGLVEESADEAIEKALENKMIYTEVSAKTGEGVNVLLDLVTTAQYFQQYINII